MHVDTNFDVKIEKRENFDAMIERETISIQNINFFDVANDKNIFFDVDTDVTNEIKKNEISKIDFAKLIDDININVDSFDEKKIAKDVSFAIVILTNFAADVKRNVDVSSSLDVIKLKDENIANSLTTNFSIFF